MTTTDNVPDTAAELIPPPDLGPAPNVIVALTRVVADLPGISKSIGSPQGYAYRGIEQITIEAQPLFARHGIVIAPHRITWQPVTELLINNRPWTDEKLVVHYRVYGPGGVDDYIDIETPGIGRDNADKGSNKAMTQAFKYALVQVLCIADAKDDADSHDVPAADAAPGDLPARPEQLTRIRELCATLHARGTEVTETNDEKEVWVLGVKMLERRDDGKLYAATKVQGADDLIGALNAKLADVLLADTEPQASPRAEAHAASPPTQPEPAPAAQAEPAVPTPEADTERPMTARERKAREQLDAVNPPKADKS